MHTSEPVLEITGLTKTFAGTRALQGASFSLHRGEILALLGENGAGKSTLIKILAGVYQADSGAVLLGGDHLTGDPRSRPISFIHQDLGLVDDMTVAENIALVNGFPRQGALISWKQVRDAAVEALKVLDAPIDVERPVRSLTATERSVVGIARAVSAKSDVLVLDEPTAALPAGDVEKLFTILRRLRDSGVGLIYVSHRIDEVFRLADRVCVLRNGQVVADAAVSEVTHDSLVEKILGRPLTELFVEPPAPSTEIALDVSDLVSGIAGPVSFKVNVGEVVGLVGRIGAGHDVVGRAIYGAEPLESGSIRVDGKLAGGTIENSRRCGIEFATGRRNEEGLATQLSVKENLWLNPASYGRNLFDFETRASERDRSLAVLSRYDVRFQDTEQPINTLSGGNQQKVVLARSLETKPRLFIVEEPTAGVDVGAKAQIYRIIDEALAEGMGVLMISSDFEEIAATCYRALVFDRGRIVAELRKPNVSEEQLTRIASGDHKEVSDHVAV
ncbi:MAG: sugar ABC transporter ATP-binding protein [Hyphomicrobiaceae bacterium]|nr:sugar ABC transporter ATP-binding protein [Hyphomicrobiaceae bacterium]